MNRPTTSLMIRVALGDEHALVAAGVARLLQVDPTIRVIGIASTGKAICDMAAAEKVDVFLIETVFRNTNGMELISFLSARAHVCVLSAAVDAHFISHSLRHGAVGYVSKNADSDELLSAVRTAARGETFFCREAQKAAFTAGFADIARSNGTALSKREREVFMLASRGQTSTEIAQALSISRRTAEAHRSRLMAKLNLKSQTDLVRYAIRNHIITA